MSLQPQRLKECCADNFKGNKEKILHLNFPAHEMAAHEKIGGKKEKSLVFLIANLKDLCFCAFYGPPSFPSNAYGTWECAAPEAVALALKQLSILRVRRKTPLNESAC